ncbi:MAG: hypothetical protein ABJD97_01585 [Betaproteobacteria bacterium]
MSSVNVCRLHDGAAAAGRVRRIRMLAVAGLAATLAACGGSQGDSPAPPPPPPPPASAFFVAGVATSPADADGFTSSRLLVFDPDHPASAVATHDFGNGSVHGLQFVPATRVDGATGAVITIGQAQAVYVFDGGLYRVDLRRGQSHEPQRLGSGSDYCDVTSAAASTADGTDGWAIASHLVSRGICYPTALVSLGTPTTEVALAGFAPGGVPLETAQGLLDGVLFAAADPADAFGFFDAASGTFRAVAGTSGAGVVLAQDPGRPDQAWIAVDVTVHLAHRTDTGWALDAAVHAGAASPTLMFASTDGLDFDDGQQFLHVDGAGGVTAYGPSTFPPGVPSVFAAGYRSDTRLFVQTGWADSVDVYHDVEFAASGDGALASALGPTDDTQRLLAILGGRGDVALVSTAWGSHDDSGNFDHRGLARLTAPGGAIDRRTAAHVAIRAAARRPGRAPDVASTWECPTPAGAASSRVECASGGVAERDLVTSSSVDLGEVAGLASGSYHLHPVEDPIYTDFGLTGVLPPLVQGAPVAVPVEVGAGLAVELFLVVPGRAGSLVRLTHDGR